jgi:integrase
MPCLTLSDQLVATLTVSSGRPHTEYFDNATPGLYVDVLASGRKSYRLRQRVEGKLKVLTLGDASSMSLAQAQEAVRCAEQQNRVQLLAPQQAPMLASAPGAWGAQASIHVSSVDAPPSLSVADFFCEHYLPYVKSYKRSWGTDDSMIRNHIVPQLGGLPMGAVLPPDLARFVEQMKERGYAPGTCNRALVLLRYGYTLALRWKLPGIGSNPVLDIRSQRNDNKIERFLTEEQVTHLMQCVRQSENEMLFYIVMFLLYTGARKREVLDARWEDVDWAQKSWRIPKTKSGKVRHIPLSSGALQLLQALQTWSASRPDLTGLDHVFPNPLTGLPFVSFYYSWDTARKLAGLPELRVHDLRHSFASFLVNAGRSLYEVQELLGHADIRTTSRYAHLSRERLFSAVEVITPLSALSLDQLG